MYFAVLFALSCALRLAYASEVGSCPPSLLVSECGAKCTPTQPCRVPQLCCPTTCGGAICVDPMTRRKMTTHVKDGSCPSRPGGAWICNHTCTGDSDCRGKLKCCRNRCKALICMTPELSVA